MIKKSLGKLQQYNLELRHITVLLFMLIIFQLVLISIQRSSFTSFLTQTQQWYQRNSAERLANSNATTLELLIENLLSLEEISQSEETRIIKSFNIVLTQQLLEQNINDVCVLVIRDNKTIVIDDGRELFNLIRHHKIISNANSRHSEAINIFEKNKSVLKNERIASFLSEKAHIDLLVPLAPHGELLGVFYMKNIPDFSSFSDEVLTSYNLIVIIYSSMMLLGLLSMYYISSYTMQERDNAKTIMFEERERYIKEEIEHEKESSFAKRIYHTHHKAEKIMGFIKSDIRNLNHNNMEEMKQRTSKYANFVSRAIYDMKWYDTPLQTIRGQIFNTDINETINFIVDNLFLRVTSELSKINFRLKLDSNIPKVKVNEFIVWEILEPLIQNSIDHAPDHKIDISVSTVFDNVKKKTIIIISDNGNGINEDLLEKDEKGVQKLFLENVTTKERKERRSGYGCYIAHQLATRRCGWKLSAENLVNGCQFILEINS